MAPDTYLSSTDQQTDTYDSCWTCKQATINNYSLIQSIYYRKIHDFPSKNVPEGHGHTACITDLSASEVMTIWCFINQIIIIIIITKQC